MQHKRPPVPVIVLLVIAVIAGIYYGFRALTSDANGSLSASGSIEATTVNVSPEMSGKVTEVFVEEGQSVKKGDPLLHLDDSLLAAQRAVAAATLDSATAGAQTAQTALNTAAAQYQIALEGALAQDTNTRLQDWFKKDPEQFNQPEWYFSRAEQMQAAQDQVDVSKLAFDDAQANLTNVSDSVEKAEFLEAEKHLLDARLAYLMIRDVNDRAQNSATSNAPVGEYNSTHCGTNEGYELADKRLTNIVYGCNGDDNLTVASEKLFDEAKAELTRAQNAYDDLLTTQAAHEVLQARAEVAVAQERYYSALDYLRGLQTGDQSVSVTAAAGALSQAQAAADQARIAIGQAQAGLDLLDEQLAKLTVYAPMDGVVLTRNVEPGEFMQPGSVALTMGDLKNLTITVYVPNNRLHEIQLNQSATVLLDAESGERPAFDAIVVHIADQAEFTPRNVQTVEGRSGTVFAVKLNVTDPTSELKIGMPSDVVFSTP